MDSFEVIGLGALNVDRVYRVERILSDGEAIADETGLFPGGSAANTVYGLARLGVKSGFIGIIGDDAEGKLLIEDFRRAGVDTSHIRVTAEAKTGSVLCLSDRQGRRSLYVSPGANNLLTMADLDLAYINQAGLLHLSSFADERQFTMLSGLVSALRDSPARLSFAPGALYARKGLKALHHIVRRTYVLFTNRDELEQLTGEDIPNGARICLEQGCEILAVTLGKGTILELGQGNSHRRVTGICYIRDAERECVIPASQKNGAIQDTTGAGDAFAAGFLYGLLKGKGLEECGRLGCLTARFAISQLGARQGLPSLNELARRYQDVYSVAL